MTNLQKLTNTAIAEVLKTTTSNVNCIGAESLHIVKTALEVYRQKLEDDENRCKQCNTGVYIDDYGRIAQGFSYCPKCGCKLKNKE